MITEKDLLVEKAKLLADKVKCENVLHVSHDANERAYAKESLEYIKGRIEEIDADLSTIRLTRALGRMG